MIIHRFCRISRHNEERGLLEIKHENETDDQLFELNERPAVVKSDDQDVLRLPSPKPLPEGVHTLRIPSPVPHEIQDIDLNAVSFQICSVWFLMPVTKSQIIFSIYCHLVICFCRIQNWHPVEKNCCNLIWRTGRMWGDVGELLVCAMKNDTLLVKKFWRKCLKGSFLSLKQLGNQDSQLAISFE